MSREIVSKDSVNKFKPALIKRRPQDWVAMHNKAIQEKASLVYDKGTDGSFGRRAILEVALVKGHYVIIYFNVPK